MIPYAQSFTATVRGNFPKFVKCVECDLDYVYMIEREATGSGTSLLFLNNSGASRKAGERAEKALREKAEREIDIVPCPQCGTIQPDMVEESRRLRHRWMFITGMVCIPATVVVGILALATQQPPTPRGLYALFLMLTILSLFGSIGLPLTKYLLNKNYDPNEDDQKARIRRGRKRAITLDAFNEIIQEEQDEQERREKRPARPKKSKQRSERSESD